MPELRKDPVIGRWVIIASERSNRPQNIPNENNKVSPKLCPFCPGNEENTPPEIIAFRPDNNERNKPGWRLRVISNKYPALIVEGELNRQAVGLYDKMHGIGAHEVIIETPDHGREMADMTDEQVRDVFWAYRERILDLVKDIRLKYVLVFKNHGEAAGASLEHPHSQLIATPIVPKRVTEELEGAKHYFEIKHSCVFCDILKQELEEKHRIVFENEDFMVIQPFAPRLPFESWILPKKHRAGFTEMEEDEYLTLGRAVKELLLRLKIALDDPPFNYIIHTSPMNNEHKESYHWHIEVIPKLTRVAGYEWGTGFYINPTAPEVAADFLRNVKINQTVST
jgi:UDPglucose--hexose-1-phosphate uridylyltransferase